MKINICFFTKCLLSLIFWFFNNFAYAQNSKRNDVILTNKKVKIEAIILQSDTIVVKYKKASDPDGPIFIIKKAEILSITRSNGDIENLAPDTEAIKLEKFARTDLRKLKSDYTLYRRKAARYKNMGYTGIFTGLLLTGVGIAVLSHDFRTYTSPNGNSFFVGPNASIGTLLVTAGLGAGIPLTIVGFVKNKRYTKKAVDVQNELKRRNQPLSLRLSPGFNPSTNSGCLSLKMTF